MFNIYPSRDLGEMEFAAVGSSVQIEFYTSKDERYFSIFSRGGDYVRFTTLKLSECKVSCTDAGYEIRRRNRLYKLILSKSCAPYLLVFKCYLWDKLLYKSFTGKVSANGKCVIERNIGSHT